MPIYEIKNDVMIQIFCCVVFLNWLNLERDLQFLLFIALNIVNNIVFCSISVFIRKGLPWAQVFPWVLHIMANTAVF